MSIERMDNRVLKDIFGRQVVQTVARSSRPHDAPRQRLAKSVQPQNCFFCPGNEHLTPPEIARVEKEGRWIVRCFPNKFPAFSPESKKAYGRHEVIVETPDHSKTLSELPAEHLEQYLSLLQERMKDAASDPKLRYTGIFKNEGKEAGASLEHSHTQLVAMPFVPKHVKKVAAKWEKIAKLPESQQKNIFYRNEGFVALCPKASRFGWEIWIVPLAKANSLASMGSSQLHLLASALKASLVALDAAVGFPPYNILFHSAPHGWENFTFHIQILPRLSQWAGFEFLTDIVMTSSIPSQSAETLAKFASDK
jgi:UDPglucose--hexose-1-phosphate uridylyltransferase